MRCSSFKNVKQKDTQLGQVV